MRRWLGGVLLAAMAACLSGCGATGPRFSEMAQGMPSLPDDHGRIFFYCDSIMGAAIQPERVRREGRRSEHGRLAIRQHVGDGAADQGQEQSRNEPLCVC